MRHRTNQAESTVWLPRIAITPSQYTTEPDSMTSTLLTGTGQTSDTIRRHEMSPSCSAVRSPDTLSQ